MKSFLRTWLAVAFMLICLTPESAAADAPTPQTSGVILYMPVVSVPYAAPQWIGPYGGSVVCLRYHPLNKNLVFAGSWGGGVYKSTNGGQSWTAASDGLGNLYINSLAVDPTNPAVVYAGTYMYGVYKSIDGGATWRAINTGVYANAVVYAIAVDPKNPQRVYIGTRPQVDGSGPPWNAVMYRSINGGASWEEALANVGGSAAQDWVYSIAIDPNDPEVVLAATHEHGPYRSENFGEDWTAVSTGISDGSGRAILFAPASAGGISYYGVWHRSGIFKSTTDGKSWTIKTSGIADSKIYTMDISKSNPALLFAATFASPGGGAGIVKSTNAGESWTLSGLQSELMYTVAANPFNSSEALAGAVDDGIFRSTDGGSSWSASNTGQTNLNVSAVAAHPLNAALIAAAVPGQGVAVSNNNGASWWWANSGLGDSQVNVLAADPQHSDVLYALTASGGLYKASWNGGLSWSLVNSNFTQAAALEAEGDAFAVEDEFTPLVDPVQDFTRPEALQAETAAVIQAGAALKSMAFAPSDANVMYLGTAGKGVFRSSDGGAHWSAAGLAGYTVSALAVDAQDANHVYATLNSSTSIQESLDGGVTWSGSQPPNGGAVSIATAADDSQRVYAAGTGISRRTGSGAWEAAGLSGVSLKAVSVSPFDSDLVLAASDSLLYISTTGGESWQIFSDHFAAAVIRSIAFDRQDAHRAYVTTGTRAVAEIVLP